MLFQVNTIVVIPTAIAYYIRSGELASNKYNLDSLEVVLTGGMKISKEVAEEFKKLIPHVSLISDYGKIKNFTKYV